MPHSGELNRRLGVLQPIEDRDEIGGVDDRTDTVAFVWAKVTPLRGREYWQANTLQTEITHRVTIRFQSWITSRHRFVIGSTSRVLQIVSVIDIGEQHEWLECMCKESPVGAIPAPVNVPPDEGIPPGGNIPVPDVPSQEI